MYSDIRARFSYDNERTDPFAMNSSSCRMPFVTKVGGLTFRIV